MLLVTIERNVKGTDALSGGASRDARLDLSEPSARIDTVSHPIVSPGLLCAAGCEASVSASLGVGLLRQ